MARQLKAVFVYLDNTLHDDSVERYQAAVRRTCERFADREGSPQTERLMEAYLKRSQEYWSNARNERGLRWSEITQKLWYEAFADCGSNERTKPNAMTEVLFHECVRGFRLFPDAQQTLIDLGTSRVVAISGELGSAKPSVEIFEEAVRRAGVASHQAAHVGDSLETDVAGAKTAGMLAIWLNRKKLEPELHAPQPDHQIASLREVAALLLQ